MSFVAHALTLAALAGAAGASEERASIAVFSEVQPGGQLPSGWQPWILDPRKPQTRYSLARVDGRSVLRADAERSVSGLLNEVRVPHAGRLHLRWRWKTERLPSGSDETRAAGDDCAARLVVSFGGDPARQHAPETIIVNPRSSRVRMIVVEQGASRRGRWLEYERDVVADFRGAFADEPGAITALGVLTDSDDTRSSALAYYGDITLGVGARKLTK